MTLADIAHAMDDLRMQGVLFAFVGARLEVHIPTCSLAPRVAHFIQAYGHDIETIVRRHGPYGCGECGRFIDLDATADVQHGDHVTCIDCGDGKLSAARLAVVAAQHGIPPALLWAVN